MKVLLIAVCVAVLACIVIPVADSQTVMDIRCTQGFRPVRLLYPAQDDCGAYIECTFMMFGYRKNCTSGQVFNDATKKCETGTVCPEEVTTMPPGTTTLESSESGETTTMPSEV